MRLDTGVHTQRGHRSLTQTTRIASPAFSPEDPTQVGTDCGWKAGTSSPGGCSQGDSPGRGPTAGFPAHPGRAWLGRGRSPAPTQDPGLRHPVSSPRQGPRRHRIRPTQRPERPSGVSTGPCPALCSQDPCAASPGFWGSALPHPRVQTGPWTQVGSGGPRLEAGGAAEF